jgi:hypothetical protein
MWRLIEEMVRSGFVMAWRFANWPTSRSPVFENPTTEGHKRLPSASVITIGIPDSSMADTTEFVVPRSMPTDLGMLSILKGAVQLWL